MIKDLIKLCKKDNINVEVKEHIIKGYNINIFNGNIKKDESFTTVSYTIKAIVNGKTVKIKVSSLDNANSIINLIKKNIKALDSKDKDIFAKNQTLSKVKNTNKKTKKKEIIEELIKFEFLKKEHLSLTNLELDYSYEYNKILIENENATLADEYKIHHFSSEIVVTKNGENQTALFNMSSKKIEFNKIKNLIKEKIKEAEDKINATSCKSGKYNIVLKNNCVYSLMNRLTQLFYAEKINNNLSCLTNKCGNKIFSDKINIIEDPSNDKYVGKRLFDDEGTKTFYKEIVKNGIFKVKLYDNKNALKDNTSSTGNSFGVRNMYIKKGELTYEELLKKCNNGIVIDYISGLHSGLDNVTGEFSLQAQGYVIKEGRLTRSLKSIILSSDIFELFINVEEVGNDLEFNNIGGGAPSLLINNISISGNK